MSILDNEGHDPNGLGNRPTLGSVERAYADGYAAAKQEIVGLRALLEVAYDGLLNHHLHDEQTRDDYTNKVGAALDDNARRRVAFGSPNTPEQSAKGEQ